MSKKIAVIDCDQTVVDSAYAWYEWLEMMTRAGYSYDVVQKHYNFSDVYASVWLDKEVAGHPYDFWRGKSVYDNLEPLKGSVEALQTLKNVGYDIVFVSAIKGNHTKSKWNFLQKHFPFMDAFIATKEKGYVRADLVIDDRNRFLNMFNGEEVKLIRKHTPFDQDVAMEQPLFASFNDWESFNFYLGRGNF